MELWNSPQWPEYIHNFRFGGKFWLDGGCAVAAATLTDFFFSATHTTGFIYKLYSDNDDDTCTCNMVEQKNGKCLWLHQLGSQWNPLGSPGVDLKLMIHLTSTLLRSAFQVQCISRADRRWYTHALCDLDQFCKYRSGLWRFPWIIMSSSYAHMPLVEMYACGSSTFGSCRKHKNSDVRLLWAVSRTSNSLKLFSLPWLNYTGKKKTRGFYLKFALWTSWAYQWTFFAANSLFVLRHKHRNWCLYS